MSEANPWEAKARAEKALKLAAVFTGDPTGSANLIEEILADPYGGSVAYQPLRAAEKAAWTGRASEATWRVVVVLLRARAKDQVAR